MIEFIQALINQDLAYEMNGNIFFDLEAYPKYGKFVNVTDDLETEDNELSKPVNNNLGEILNHRKKIIKATKEEIRLHQDYFSQ